MIENLSERKKKTHDSPISVTRSLSVVIKMSLIGILVSLLTRPFQFLIISQQRVFNLVHKGPV